MAIPQAHLNAVRHGGLCEGPRGASKPATTSLNSVGKVMINVSSSSQPHVAREYVRFTSLSNVDDGALEISLETVAILLLSRALGLKSGRREIKFAMTKSIPGF